MSARKRPRYPALPTVQADDTLCAEHIRLSGKGFVLDRFLHVKINRRRATAAVSAWWRKPIAGMPRGCNVTISHHWTIDLRSQAR